MTFDYPKQNDAEGNAQPEEDSPFSEQEWDAIEALSEPGAIY